MTDTHRPLIAIVYHSGSGHTAEMAHAVARGAAAVPGASVKEFALQAGDFTGGRWSNEALLGELDAADAIILGSPTYMGCVSGQMKSFMDATSSRYLQRRWVDKLAAAFTISGTPAGDKMNTLFTCATFAMQHGMIWVGVAESPVTGEGYNRLGFYFGAAGVALFEPPSEAPNAEDKRTGEMLGRRVASLALRLSHKPQV
jgi:NAD(P)H dehydrogenase (quinone)